MAFIEDQDCPDGCTIDFTVASGYGDIAKGGMSILRARHHFVSAFLAWCSDSVTRCGLTKNCSKTPKPTVK